MLACSLLVPFVSGGDTHRRARTAGRGDGLLPALLPTATGPRRRLPWRHAWGTAEVGRGSVAALSPAEGDLAGPFGVWEGDDEAAATAAGAGAGGELCGRGGGDRGVVGGGRMRRGEEGAGDQLGAMARLRWAAGIASAGRQSRRLLPARPQRAGCSFYAEGC